MFGIPDLDASAKASQVKTIVFWQWFEEQSMSRRRSDAAAAVVGRKVSLIFLLGFNENTPQIYVCGGFDGVEPTSSVEVFDTNVGTWATLSPMSHMRSGVKVNYV